MNQDADSQELLSDLFAKQPATVTDPSGNVAGDLRSRIVIFQDTNTIAKIYPGGGSGSVQDPLLSKIIGLAGYKVILAALIALACAIMPVLLSIYEGTFIDTSLKPDLAHDIGYWNSFILGLPTIVVALAAYFGRLQAVLLELCVTNIFSLNKSEWNTFAKDANKIFGNPALLVTPLIVGIAVTVIGVMYFVLGDFNSWHSPSNRQNVTIAGWVHVPLIFFFYYFIVGFVLRLIATFIVLRRFFRFKANIHALNPDGCGGLSPLGSLSMSLNFGVFMFGIICVLGIISNMKSFDTPLYHWLNLLIIGGYFAGATIAFFLPLWAAHTRMKTEKNSTLGIISRNFQAMNDNVMHRLTSNAIVDKTDYEGLESLRQMHKAASKMPIFPFNTKTVSSFAGSVLTPVLIFVVEQMLSKWLFN